MDLKRTWSEEYKGIRIDVVHWGVDNLRPSGVWNYYLYIPNDGIPADKRKALLPKRSRSTYGEKRLIWDYMRCGLANLPWHGGITYYRQHYRDDGTPSMIEAGCDYLHIWDQEQYYDENVVMHEARETVDALWAMTPNMLVWSRWDGKYVPLAQQNMKPEERDAANEANRRED